MSTPDPHETTPTSTVSNRIGPIVEATGSCFCIPGHFCDYCRPDGESKALAEKAATRDELFQEGQRKAAALRSCAAGIGQRHAAAEAQAYAATREARRVFSEYIALKDDCRTLSEGDAVEQGFWGDRP